MEPMVSQAVPLELVGGTAFGRYPKISLEETWNMIVSDEWMVPYAGYQQLNDIAGVGSQGRGLFNSVRYGNLIAVVDNGVYTIDKSYNVAKIGTISTSDGDVFIDENDNKQIAICDKKDLWIFNWDDKSFQKVTDLDFIPGYVAFQNGYFIAACVGLPRWRLSAPGNGLSWPSSAQAIGSFQTKPDNTVACVRMPGKGNLLFVMGSTVTEAWVDVGSQLFPYQRSSSFNIDYGCINPATIAFGDRFIVWLGINEKSGISLLYSEGGEPQQISNDGFNYLFANLKYPTSAYGFLFKQDGHLIYQFTFPKDNLSFAYDFETKMFFTLSDESMNFHPAKKVVFFNNLYIFNSFNDGNLYELNSAITTLNGEIAPRIRITKHMRFPDSLPRIMNKLNIPIEQGVGSEQQRVYYAISRDGGESFSNEAYKDLRPQGLRQNRFQLFGLGRSNDLILRLRLASKNRFVFGNGMIEFLT
jgi:hypothetical protein